MATVPGDPPPPNLIPKELQPTQADLMMAAAIMHQQGKFDQPAPTRMAMDTSRMRPSTNVEDTRLPPFDPERSYAPGELREQQQLTSFGYEMQATSPTTSGKVRPEDELGTTIPFRRR
jgi:hypothetical protein